MAASKRSRGLGPALLTHANGQYFIRIRGRNRYLGSAKLISLDEAKRRRFEVLSRDANGELGKTCPKSKEVLTVARLVDLYVETFCARRSYYRDDYGNPAGHAMDVAAGLALLKRFGEFLATDFRRSHLVSIRDEMISEYSRSTANRRVARVKEAFRWAAERDLIPESVWTALLPVKGVTQSEGRPPKKVKAVPEHIVRASLPHLPDHFAAVVRLLLLSGARAGEILGMRKGEITYRDDGLWVLHVQDHKTAWRGNDRRVYFDKEAQAVLRPWLPLDPSAYVFRPTRRKGKNSFNSNDLAAAVWRAWRKAGVPRWHVHQLRHNAATRFEQLYGIQVARVLLGHTSATMTHRYVHPDERAAIEKLRLVQP